MIGIFDVLEHLEDDEDTLGRLMDLLTPRGALVLTVPAHPWLWSEFDEVARHRRRYTRDELVRKLEARGFRVEYATHYMMPVLVLAWLHRRVLATLRLGRRRDTVSTDGREDAARELRIVPVVNGMLELLLRREASWIGRRRRIPAGSSLIAVARKPESSRNA